MWHFVAADAGLALQPGEVAAGVNVQEVRMWWLPNADANVQVASWVDVAIELEHHVGGGHHEWEQEQEADDRSPPGSHGGGKEPEL